MRQTYTPWRQPGWRTAVNVGVAFLLTYLLQEVFGSDQVGIIFANTLLTADIITKEALDLLQNNLVFARTVNRTYDPMFGTRGGAARGDTIRVRKPPRYRGRSGQAMAPEAIVETSVNVAMEEEFGVDLEVSDWDMTLSLDNFSEKSLAPAVSRIANYIDQRCMEKAALTIPYAVGTINTIPTALLTYGLAAAKLSDNAAPLDDRRYMTIGPLMEVYIVDAAKSLFHASAEIAAQYRKGKMGHALGFEWQMDQNVFTHTVGTLGGTPLINGAQTGASLATDGWTASVTNVVRRGDRFTIASVNHVNPASYQSTNELQQFVITVAASSNASGQATLSVSPTITVAGAQQTVDAQAGDNAAITMRGTSAQTSVCGIAHHRDAIALVMADLPMPKGKDMAGVRGDPRMNASIRFVRDFETRSGQWLTRLDVIFGVADLRSESLGCVINS